MDTLRSNLIRLAHTKPELRPTLLPLLKEGTTSPTLVKIIESSWIKGGKKARRFWVRKALESLLTGIDGIPLDSRSYDVGEFCTYFGEEEFARALMVAMDRFGDEGRAMGT